MVYSHDFDNLKDRDYQKAMFEAENLDELILGMLALRLKEHATTTTVRARINVTGKFILHFFVI